MADAAADAAATPASAGVAGAARAAAEVSDRGVEAGVSEPPVDVSEEAELPTGATGVEPADPVPETPPWAKVETNVGPPWRMTRGSTRAASAAVVAAAAAAAATVGSAGWAGAAVGAGFAGAAP